MLKTILSISGKPGLYKLISQGRNMLIVESLTDKKRFPAYGNPGMPGRSSSRRSTQRYSSSSISELEDLINDILTFAK